MSGFFPSRTLALYMARLFIVRSFVILAMLVLVLQTLDLLGESSKILSVAGNSDADVWRYVGLRMPQIIARFLPFSVLLGTILTLMTMNQSSEIISMKSGGMSAHQILAPLIVASLGVAAISFVFNERVLTRSNATLAAWQKVDYARVPIDSGTRTNVWVRSGTDLIHVRAVNGRGAAATLDGVTIFRRTANRMTAIIAADSAAFVADAGPLSAGAAPASEPNGARAAIRRALRGDDPVSLNPRAGWRLVNARVFDVAAGTQRRLGTIIGGRGVTPDRFTLANVKGDQLTFVPLRRAIADLRAAGRPTNALESVLWHKIAGPLSSVLMPLLGAVAGFGLARSGQLFVRAILGMALGFLYFVADNFALAMGNFGAYTPLLAAFGPVALFLFIGEMVLIRSEE